MKKGIAIPAILMALGMAAMAQTPPPQPLLGPGGSGYSFSITSSGPYWAAGHENDNEYRYFLYEPSPAPFQAPVVLFLHGVFSVDPADYGGWIQHMVRKGHVVVWVQYQAGLTPTWNYIRNIEAAWKDALERLDNPAEAHVRPERDSKGMLTSVVGHSAGGFLSAVLAARATRPMFGLEQPRAIVAFEPGSFGLIPAEDYSRIPSSTKLLLVAGEDDTNVCVSAAANIWSKTGQIPDVNRDFLLVRSDSHGSPAQIANHFFPNSTGYRDTAAIDARDYFVTYKLSVAALNCVFRGNDCSIAFGNGNSSQVDMGVWSDGLPVKTILWSTTPSTVPAPCR